MPCAAMGVQKRDAGTFAILSAEHTPKRVAEVLISASPHIHITASARQFADELDIGVRRTVTMLEDILCANRIFLRLGAVW